MYNGRIENINIGFAGGPDGLGNGKHIVNIIVPAIYFGPYTYTYIYIYMHVCMFLCMAASGNHMETCGCA